MKRPLLLIAGLLLLVIVPVTRAEIKVTTERNASERASARFKFNNVPSPAKSDAATAAKFAILDGERDPNGGDITALHDGKLPNEDDQPSANFFFRAGTDGGRLLLDLGKAIDIRQINIYSWHAGSRGPQVCQLYASDGQSDAFNAEPKMGTDLEKAGWKSIAKIDTRPREGDAGGQYGASVSDSSGVLGKYRYLIFDIRRTEDADGFGNTFYSEIDVLDRDAPKIAEAVTIQRVEKMFEAEGGKYRFTFDTTVAPDLTEWAYKELSPVVLEWYPKLIAMLPSEGFAAPTNVTILFRDNMGGTPAS
ncbi:MAG TPA: hypothetical protein VK846_08095, partial [Candidatus Limnocylindria bacterium]|nr:hypothetical protein [Candidatus Limnocylindria bacterium]